MELTASKDVADLTPPQPFLRRHALYPNQYLWFVFLSALDVLLTALALLNGAREANIVAAWMLRQYGVGGLILLKFTAVPIVIALCQIVGTHKPGTGQRLAEWVVALAAIPIVIGVVILLS